MSLPELDISTLVQHAQLTNIMFFELSARQSEVPQAAIVKAEDEPPEIESTQFLQTAHRDDGGGFRVRVRAVVTVPQGQVVADAAAEYELEDFKADDIANEVMLEFSNEVAVMHLIPYLRHEIADLSQQVFGAPLLMPMLKRGDMHFEASSAEPGGDMPVGATD